MGGRGVSSHTKAEEHSLTHRGETLSCWEVVLGVPQGSVFGALSNA